MKLIKNLAMVVCIAAFSNAFCAKPIDRKATPETKALYDNLKKIEAKGIMFGHQDDAMYGYTWKYEKGRSDVKSVCGDYPAVIGFELGHLETGAIESLDSVNFDSIKVRIQDVYRRGNVITISWHLNNPLGGTAWDNKTTEAVKSILPGGEKHSMYITWLNRLATFLGSLKDDYGKPIPVMFRPFHEHTGNWFWWGKTECTPQQYKDLWIYTVKYLTQKKKLHNLLFIYSPSYCETEQKYFERYPGDDWVDIFGVDIYQGEKGDTSQGFIRQIQHDLDFMTKEADKRGKIAVLSEAGLRSIPLQSWWTDVMEKAITPYRIAYFLVWRNATGNPPECFGPYPGQVSCKSFIEMKNQGKILFNKDLPDMYK